MKMNINKACDLNSISVFPPNLRRRSAEPQASQQLRSQQSQQSFSQGPSSQRGCGFSQMTQSSVDEHLINDQRFGSQERDLSLKKVSCLPPINHKRDDSQFGASRSSSALTRRWSSASVGESKSQISEELEQRFGMMENSLSRFGMMLDSIQSDIMQASRGTKEVFLETERIQQKLILQDTSLQQLIREQADAKASLDGGFKTILEEFIKNPDQEKLEKICLMLTNIPEQVKTALQKIQREICHTFTREIQVLASLKMPEPRVQVPTAPRVQQAKENLPEQRGPAAKVLAGLKMPDPRIRIPTAPQAKENFPEQRGPATKSNSYCNTTLKTKQQQLPRNPSNSPARALKTNLSPKIQVGCWKTVKPEQRIFKKRAARESVKSEGTQKQFEQCSVIIDSDEDMDRGFSCLIGGNTKGANFEWEAEKETERILRAARRTKRKFGNPIIIN